MADLVINVNKMVVSPQAASNEEEQPLVSMAECRICQEEELIQNLENPCACTGSLKVLFLFIFLLKYC